MNDSNYQYSPAEAFLLIVTVIGPLLAVGFILFRAVKRFV